MKIHTTKTGNLSDYSGIPQGIFLNEENFKNNNKESLIKIDMGVHDPITGQSNSEIAALSRSQHKSQGFGSSPALGSRLEYLLLVKENHYLGIIHLKE